MTPHEPTDACAVLQNIHCYGCGLDHEGKAWLWCFECGHAYRSPRELRKAFRRKAWEMLSLDLEGPSRVPWLFSNAWHSSIAQTLWRILTARASKIYFCQLCLHDFI